MKSLVDRVPRLHKLLLWRAWRHFGGSRPYWEQRYSEGGTSGSGSYGALAEFKASVLNRFVQEYDIQRVVEFGCGDGNQLSLAKYPLYVGLDVSRHAIKLCKTRFSADSTKSFFLYDPECFVDKAHLFRCDASLSLDVLFHLVEDEVYERHLADLFQCASRYVIIYSSNTDIPAVGPQERHRRFSEYVAATFSEWRLVDTIANPFPLANYPAPLGSLADFFVYRRAVD
jgi:hypothetical protein